MKIQDNIIYGEPVENAPTVSLGQHLFEKLRANADHIVQVSQKYFQVSR